MYVRIYTCLVAYATSCQCSPSALPNNLPVTCFPNIAFAYGTTKSLPLGAPPTYRTGIQPLRNGPLPSDISTLRKDVPIIHCLDFAIGFLAMVVKVNASLPVIFFCRSLQKKKQTNNLQRLQAIKKTTTHQLLPVMSDLVGQCPHPLSLNEWGPLVDRSQPRSRGCFSP